MSRHHRAIRHTTYSTEIRAEWQTRIDAGDLVPCLHCRRAILPGQPWDLAHRQAAERGGRTTRENTHPAHRSCNRSDGGRRGAAIIHRTTQHDRGIRPW